MAISLFFLEPSDRQSITASVRSYVPLRLSDVVLAERLRSQSTELTFFDSLHAAMSKRVSTPLLSADPTYKKVGVTTVTYEEL
ncbi:MAG: hypothetical protein ACE5Z5_08470 [Candidatus Bathyarchaeia archaeon]